jgi:hypothetical protein
VRLAFVLAGSIALAVIVSYVMKRWDDHKRNR